MDRLCKYCNYCENIGRASVQSHHSYGRKYYYCKHKDASKSKEKTTGHYDNFIGYGDNTYESPIKLKRHPKWCPLEAEVKANE